MSCDLSNFDFPEPTMTPQFVEWLKEKPIENMGEFRLQDLYEIYINSIMWKEIPEDPAIPVEHLKVRV